MSEVERVEKEMNRKEELFNNHGHDKNFFKAPELHTKLRDNTRKKKDGQDVIDVTEEEKL